MKSRKSGSSLSCTGRGLFYLLEPIMVAVVVIAMLALFLPEAQVEQNYRLMGLHAQDIAAVIQKTGSVPDSCEKLRDEVESLASMLNPEYSPCFRLYGSMECPGECEGICARRSWANSTESAKIEVCLG